MPRTRSMAKAEAAEKAQAEAARAQGPVAEGTPGERVSSQQGSEGVGGKDKRGKKRKREEEEEEWEGKIEEEVGGEGGPSKKRPRRASSPAGTRSSWSSDGSSLDWSDMSEDESMHHSLKGRGVSKAYKKANFARGNRRNQGWLRRGTTTLRLLDPYSPAGGRDTPCPPSRRYTGNTPSPDFVFRPSPEPPWQEPSPARSPSPAPPSPPTSPPPPPPAPALPMPLPFVLPLGLAPHQAPAELPINWQFVTECVSVDPTSEWRFELRVYRNADM
ncbi:hypothetical protein TWF730_002597 [Orbilia blumenaviensis]|uniref:Uncharacterized protein n=1 Tax=Orbilia blumenaviensis TaxID=1796055 RepID=A0AAV9UDW2_9PEZI